MNSADICSGKSHDPTIRIRLVTKEGAFGSFVPFSMESNSFEQYAKYLEHNGINFDKEVFMNWYSKCANLAAAQQSLWDFIGKADFEPEPLPVRKSSRRKHGHAAYSVADVMDHLYESDEAIKSRFVSECLHISDCNKALWDYMNR